MKIPLNSHRSRIPPAIVLFFLSPTIAELLSGSAPPAEFFNPFPFLILASLYGSGAVLIREVCIRWRKGYSSLLLLGAAYGIVEEGLMVKSFFDPAWPDLGLLGVYGRWIGVNWVWVEMLTIYHAVFSISIPILLVELIYSSRRRDRWINNRSFIGLTILFIGVVLFGYLVLTPYRPPLLQYFATVLVVILLTYLAWRLPSDYGRYGSVKLRRPAFFWMIGFLGTLVFFLIFFASPHIIPLPIIVIFLGILLVLSVTIFLKRFDWSEKSDLHRFTLLCGGLSFFILLSPLQELDKTRTDNPQGMSLVGLAFALGLLLLGLYIRRRSQIEG